MATISLRHAVVINDEIAALTADEESANLLLMALQIANMMRGASQVRAHVIGIGGSAEVLQQGNSH